MHQSTCMLQFSSKVCCVAFTNNQLDRTSIHWDKASSFFQNAIASPVPHTPLPNANKTHRRGRSKHDFWPFKACPLGQMKTLMDTHPERTFSKINGPQVSWSPILKNLWTPNWDEQKVKSFFPLRKNRVIYAHFSVFKQHYRGLKQTSSQQEQQQQQHTPYYHVSLDFVSLSYISNRPQQTPLLNGWEKSHISDDTLWSWLARPLFCQNRVSFSPAALVHKTACRFLWQLQTLLQAQP